MPRQLANVTHARPQPPKLSPPPHAERRQYGGLVEVSLRYTPVAGGLHTRYAPVRRSPPVHCCTALPLDLHVLGLPLAFILSQDQTLHCKNCSRNLLTRLVSGTPGCPQDPPTHAISLVPSFQRSLAFTSLPRRGVSLSRKRVQRYEHFPIRQNFFSLFPHVCIQQPVAQRRKNQTFFHDARKKTRKTAPRHPVFRKNHPLWIRKKHDICAKYYRTAF